MRGPSLYVIQNLIRTYEEGPRTEMVQFNLKKSGKGGGGRHDPIFIPDMRIHFQSFTFKVVIA